MNRESLLCNNSLKKKCFFFCNFLCNVTTTKFMCFVEKKSVAVTNTDDKIEYMNISSYLLKTQNFLRKNGSVHEATISELKKNRCRPNHIVAQ